MITDLVRETREGNPWRINNLSAALLWSHCYTEVRHLARFWYGMLLTTQISSIPTRVTSLRIPDTKLESVDPKTAWVPIQNIRGGLNLFQHQTALEMFQMILACLF